MEDLPIIVYLCIFIGFVMIALAIVNALFWNHNRDSLTTTPKSLRIAWGISLGSLLIMYLAPISLVILGHNRFFGAGKIEDQPDRTLALLALVNSCWSAAAGTLFIVWILWFM